MNTFRALRLGLATISVGVPPRRVGISERVVAAIGVAVEGLGACRVLNVGVHRKETARQGIVASSIHVNEAEGRHVFVACEAAVEHRRVVISAAPCLGFFYYSFNRHSFVSQEYS